MNRSVLPLVALLAALILVLAISRATSAQGDKPTATITLPASGSTNSSGDAFSITQNGLGRGGYFAVTNSANVTAGLEVRTYSTSTNAIALAAGVMSNRPGAGSSAIVATNYGSGSAGYAIKATHKGNGVAIYAEAIAAAGRAIYGSSRASSGNGSGIYGETFSGSGFGVYGVNRASSGGSGVYGESLNSSGSGVHGINSNTDGGYGVYGEAASANGRGVYGVNRVYMGGYGVYGEATNGVGVYGKGYRGVYGEGNESGVYASGRAYGVYALGAYGVYGDGGTYGVYGKGTTYGLYGDGDKYGAYGHGNTGVYGQGGTYGVYGSAALYGTYGTGPYGVYGKGTQGVFGETTSTSSSAYGGVFKYNIYVYNRAIAAGGMAVAITDPRDSSKLIQQAGVISPEQLGMTNGNVVLDNTGRASITLPAWFGGIYGDYRYMLTPVGDSAGLFVASESKGGFTIAGGKPGLKVSWMVSGTRQDAAAKADPLRVEVNRADVEPLAPPAAAQPAPPGK